MMCCCREGAEADGQATAMDQTGPGGGVEEATAATSARVVRLATFDDDLMSPVELDQLTNRRSTSHAP